MTESSNNTVDITRNYFLRSIDGEVSPVVVRFFDCEPVDDGANWSIKFSVSGVAPKYQTARVVYGVDALQALLGAMRVVRAVLESEPSYIDGRLTLHGGSFSGLGLDI